MTTRKTKKSAPDLPPDVRPEDLEWPKTPKYGTKSYEEFAGLRHGSDHGGQLTFYKTTGFGWVLTTLGIGKATGRRAGKADRTYGIEIKSGKTCRVGFGPHVTATVQVQVHPGNVERLQKYVELFRTGLTRAGEIRDRISTRRAQGQEHRAAGRTHWYW